MATFDEAMKAWHSFKNGSARRVADEDTDCSLCEAGTEERGGAAGIRVMFDRNGKETELYLCRVCLANLAEVASGEPAASSCETLIEEIFDIGKQVFRRAFEEQAVWPGAVTQFLQSVHQRLNHAACKAGASIRAHKGSLT